VKPGQPLYFDYAATTPVDETVAAAMMTCLTRDGTFANPASRSHFYGWQAEALVEQARGQLARLINADPRAIVWTSGATESNNLAIKGLAALAEPGRRHLVTSALEHKATLDPLRQLQTQGFEITYVAPSPDGSLSPQAVAEALRADTLMVALMQVNNELGSLTDIAAIANLCKPRGIHLHVDAAQSLGKIPVDVQALGAQTLSLSAHKFYGPKGVGALYVQRDPEVKLAAQIQGGGHQRGLRSGTLPTHQLVGLGAAAAEVARRLTSDSEHIAAISQRFLQGLDHIEGVKRNGSGLGAIVNIQVDGVDGELLLAALPQLALSTGSACTSASLEPSHVLTALGVPKPLAQSSLRFSFGRYTEANDIDVALEHLSRAITTLRARRVSRF
jgi:cysteine desulfurase